MAPSGCGSEVKTRRRTRLLAFQIILEMPEACDEEEQENTLHTIARLGLERQALEAVEWHLQNRPALRKVTARMEQ